MMIKKIIQKGDDARKFLDIRWSKGSYSLTYTLKIYCQKYVRFSLHNIPGKFQGVEDVS